MIHSKVEEAFQEIDAGLFSSDLIECKEFRERLAGFLRRWRKQLDDTAENRATIEELAGQYESGELKI